MGAFEDDWIENAPNGVSYEEWRSGEYLEPDYWERKRCGSSYKSTSDKLNEANNTIKYLRQTIERLRTKIGTLEAEKDHYKSIAEYYEPPKKKHYKKKKYGKHYSKFNDTDVSN